MSGIRSVSSKEDFVLLEVPFRERAGTIKGEELKLIKTKSANYKTQVKTKKLK